MSIFMHKRPDLSHELPNWVFDERCCSGMRLGPPEISIDGLNELRLSWHRSARLAQEILPLNKAETGAHDQRALAFDVGSSSVMFFAENLGADDRLGKVSRCFAQSKA
ncbi:hypothetical protein [Rhizobium mayense]|uniref:Uncharacterized protein n=1 Tax=Rhizobium mayense TaxID=1312184 RepID=A0ABT7K5X8_9HYPH|nr:hypothetical protein [Rhizobium mayense]MDL2403562.1 hypothetical protein [Rhizobium mayense]